jgi:transcriptional regulator with XRE-family HTH domain
MEQLGYSNSVYSKWNDKTLPRSTTLMKVAEYFGVSVEYLKGNETKAIQTPKTANETNEFSNLSEQEKAILRLFRSTTEDGRLDMIAALKIIQKDTEKKCAATDTKSVG